MKERVLGERVLLSDCGCPYGTDVTAVLARDHEAEISENGAKCP
jgi:hypothetical protein